MRGVMETKSHVYSPDMRMKVFDHIVAQVPTKNIPDLIAKNASRSGITLTNVPHRSTVEAMVRELGAISDFQTAEAILEKKDCTLGFDATTQEGVHLNSIHVTTETTCYVVAADELPGGTAEDYFHHIDDSVTNLANEYAHFLDADFKTTRESIIYNISNSLTDHCAANHAAIELVNTEWNKTLNELNCHLHPLDSIATKVRTALKECEGGAEGQVWGNDCFAGKIVLQMNKLRFKDGKGDPQGFKTFLDDHDLPRGLVLRYRGNRLHVLFHICGIYMQHHFLFKKYLEQGTTCGGLRASVLADFVTIPSHVEMQVLGLMGKLLTGPWMKTFYTSAGDQIDHVEGIEIVKEIVQKLKDQKDTPLDLLSSEVDFFGKRLDDSDSTLRCLQEAPKDEDMFIRMMRSCIQAIIDVLEHQYKKYFASGWEISEKLRSETKSVRSHNMDAEEIMGMFSAAKQKANNATVCYLSCKMRGQKNRTVAYLDSLEKEKRYMILKKAVQIGSQQRHRRRMKQKDLRAELSRRQAENQQARETAVRRYILKKSKKIKQIETCQYCIAWYCISGGI